MLLETVEASPKSMYRLQVTEDSQRYLGQNPQGFDQIMADQNGNNRSSSPQNYSIRLPLFRLNRRRKKKPLMHTLVRLTILVMHFVLELDILLHPRKGRMMASQTLRHSYIAQQGFEHFHHRESTVKHPASARCRSPETARITIQHPRKSTH